MVPRDFPKGAQMADKKTYSDPSRQGGSHQSDEGRSPERDREKDFGSRHEDESRRRPGSSSSSSDSSGSDPNRKR